MSIGSGRDRNSITGDNNNFNVLGNNNTVTVNLAGGSPALDELLRELGTRIGQSRAHTDATKADVAVQIETIRGQLKKTRPDSTLMRTVWKGIERSVAVAEFATLATRIAGYLADLA